MKKLLTFIAGLVIMVACGGGMPIFAAHYVTLTWTVPTNQVANGYINLYRGTTTGGETATPINNQPLPTTITTFQDNNVLANGKYYYIAKQCAVDQATSTEVCSGASNEASTTIPLASGDLGVPGILTAVAH